MDSFEYNITYCHLKITVITPWHELLTCLVCWVLFSYKSHLLGINLTRYLLKGHLLCHLLLYESQLSPECVWSFRSKYPTDHLYYFEDAKIENKMQKLVKQDISVTGTQDCMSISIDTLREDSYITKHLFQQ